MAWTLVGAMTVATNQEPYPGVLRQISVLLQAGALGSLPDAHLLERYMTGGNDAAEAAFATLVQRHGRMVWRVCLRVLGETHQAEDAFQATFLVLAQQARSVRRRESLASWLHGVAYRVASCSRSAGSRRKRHEERYAQCRVGTFPGERAETAELARIVHEELSRLPERLRAPIVLCDLEEVSHEQAALRLGWPVGTVKSRLSRGRDKLRSRMVRRGLAPSLALAGVAAVEEASPATCSGPLIHSTVQIVHRLGTGLPLAGPLSSSVILGAKEVSRAMWINKIRWAAACVLTASVVGLGTGLLRQQSEARQEQPAGSHAATATTGSKPGDDAIWARHAGNLKRVGLALHNYEAAEGHYPPAAITGNDGKPLLSWRVAILPYLKDYDGRSRSDLYKEFHLDEPWDSPHNRPLLERMPAAYASAVAGRQPFTTVYRGFVSVQPNAEPEPQGAAGAASGPRASSRRRSPSGTMGGMRARKEKRPVSTPAKASDRTQAAPPAGVAEGDEPVDEPAQEWVPTAFFREGKGMNVGEITDGTSNTLAVVEAADAVPWTRPDELPFAPDQPLPRLGGSMAGGFAALFVHGEVRFLDRSLNEASLRCLITANGGEVIDTSRMPQLSLLPPAGTLTGTRAGELGERLRTDLPRYAGAATLENAVGILRDQLRREGKSALAAWLGEDRTRQSIEAGLRLYETYLRRVGEPQPARRQFEIVKADYEQIARHGTWPVRFWFSADERQETRDGITYDHYEIRLNHEAVDEGKPFPFSLLVLDLLSGPVDPRF